MEPPSDRLSVYQHRQNRAAISERNAAQAASKAFHGYSGHLPLPRRTRSFTQSSTSSSFSSTGRPPCSSHHKETTESSVDGSSGFNKLDSCRWNPSWSSSTSTIKTNLTYPDLDTDQKRCKPRPLTEKIKPFEPDRAGRDRASSCPATRPSVAVSGGLKTNDVVGQQTTPSPTGHGQTSQPATTTAARPQLLPALQTRARTLMSRQKLVVTGCLIVLNVFFIFATWWWPKYYYFFLPFITLPLALNCCMIASILFFTVRNLVKPEKQIIPAELESMILLMPCYNETFEECTKSLDSLVAQVGIDGHQKAIMIICDGRVRGPGMDKTTGQYLNDDILVDCDQREIIRGAYIAWDSELMDIELTTGTYKGVPYLCIVKQQNQGKRDSLLVIRSFLHNFNLRKTRPRVIFSPRFFRAMSSWLTHDVGMQRVDFLVGMDADTVFDPTCISELVKESRYEHTVGVCGYVAVDFKKSPFNPWSLYQSSEYTIAQALRRLHQSIATHKVSCLPGCCQLLRVCETTCGDLVLLEKFGYKPEPLDGIITQIRATASEDRNHVCLMLTTFPEAQTRQALWARAYTDVPHSWTVFLSQRRRWTLGATANDLLLVTARGTQWWERIVALANVLTWCLNVFVIASIACMITAFLHQPFYVILAFAGVMIVPLIYYIGAAVWIPQTYLERLQYLAGLAMFVFCGPWINISILVYALYNMDSFGWGKTRQVVAEEDSNGNSNSSSASIVDGEKHASDDETLSGAYEKTANDEESQLGPLKKPKRALFVCDYSD